MMFKQVLCMIW